MNEQRFYVRVPADLTPEERNGLSRARIQDRGIIATGEAKWQGEGRLDEGPWDESRIVVVAAADAADASRRVARALGRDEPNGGFEVVQGPVD
ncbi:MAG TPA: hypothetical protein VNT32_02340 [Thermoleophilaceae bacterium]|nr:hypothetical protein [Thermoleophilaceae bacterium]